ncbi:hypothetical protein AHAS_Ahas17G0138500 [Arachis hypogaea]
MIGGQWGEVVGCDKETESCCSFCVGRILIDTCVLDVIKKWVHITIGTSGFDILVKEMGREVYSMHCDLENVAEDVVSCDHRKDVMIRECDDVATRSEGLTNLIDNGDQAATVVTKVLREEVEDKDRLVNFESILNKWSYEHSRNNQRKLITDQSNYGDIEGLADFVGFEGSYEADSKITISWSNNCKHNGRNWVSHCATLNLRDFGGGGDRFHEGRTCDGGFRLVLSGGEVSRRQLGCTIAAGEVLGTRATSIADGRVVNDDEANSQRRLI